MPMASCFTQSEGLQIPVWGSPCTHLSPHLPLPAQSLLQPLWLPCCSWNLVVTCSLCLKYSLRDTPELTSNHYCLLQIFVRTSSSQRELSWWYIWNYNHNTPLTIAHLTHFPPLSKSTAPSLYKEVYVFILYVMSTPYSRRIKCRDIYPVLFMDIFAICDISHIKYISIYLIYLDDMCGIN